MTTYATQYLTRLKTLTIDLFLRFSRTNGLLVQQKRTIMITIMTVTFFFILMAYLVGGKSRCNTIKITSLITLVYLVG